MLCLATTTAAPAFAQPPPQTARAPLAESLTGEAKRDYDAAKLLFADGDMAGAAAKFQHAYDVSKDPRLLYNVAVCEKNQRRYFRVQVLLQRYLREMGGSLSTQDRTNVEETLTAIKSFVSTLKLNVQDEGAVVMIDGEEVGRAPITQPIPIDLGRRTIRVTKPGFLPYEKTIDVAGGTEIPLDVSLVGVPQVVREGPGRIAVVAGEGDSIYVDGKPVATGRWEGPVQPGSHSIRVSGKGMKTYEQQVDVAPGTTRSFNVTLERQGSSAAIWPWIIGGAAVIGGTIAAILLLKPTDTQAPQTPGTLPPGLIELKGWGFLR